jgi:anion-transporting  ArsA/GET3 family ATPase
MPSSPGDTPGPPGSLDRLLAAKSIAIFCGPGGVGKTSVAAASAAVAASRLGGKVLVVTVDPARRLADALGLAALGNLERPVPADRLKAAGLEVRHHGPPGTKNNRTPGLWAAMLDTKQSWDDLVLRHARDDVTAYRILENRLYHNLTARFVQSHDYIAMERLHEIHAEGGYDLIVVDTPPTRNALDFLEAPERMADFFGSRLLRWLTTPYRVGGKRGARMINLASRPFYQVADRLLGGKFLEDIAEFFLNFQTMYDGFVERARSVQALLHDRRTTFVVVSTLETAPLREAEFFIAELSARKLHLGAVVLNKTLPDYLQGGPGDAAARALVADPGPAAQAAAGADADLDQTTAARVLATVGESFLNFEVAAKREAELRGELGRLSAPVLRVPAFEEDIHDLRGLVRLGECLFGS